MKKEIIVFALCAINVFSALELDKWPAARRHVVKETINGKEFFFKKTSKLQKFHNYDFSCTSVGGHKTGNQELDKLIHTVADEYGENGTPAFAVVDFVSGTGTSITNGNANGAYADNLKLDKIRESDVFQITSASHLSKDNCMSVFTQNNISKAISEHGVGMLGSHGTGDGGTNEGTSWTYFLDTINPGNPSGHGTRENRTTVYVSNKYRQHMVVENIIIENHSTLNESVTHVKEDGGTEVKNTPIRWMRFEPYQYRKSLEQMEHVKVLIKYDPEPVGDIPSFAKFDNANNFSWVIDGGKGKIGYYPIGHHLRELTDFDGLIDNVGGKWHNNQSSKDLIRYAGQMVFFLAGYDKELCDDSCIDLPIVDENDLIIGKNVSAEDLEAASIDGFSSQKVQFHPGNMEVKLPKAVKFQIEILNPNGTVLHHEKGAHSVKFSYDKRTLEKGVYFLKVTLNSQQVFMQKYVVL